MSGLRDGTHLYPIHHRSRYGERPGFKITELHIQPDQKVPWHAHTFVRDSFYVVKGKLKLSLRNPEETIILGPTEYYSVAPERPHEVSNAAQSMTVFLCIGDAQSAGEYDFIPLK